MAANTAAIAIANATDQDQVSGLSLFWALITIALTAMYQPSFCGHLWSEDAFKTTLWPHRSSPIVCLVDALADMYIIIRRFWHRSKYANYSSNICLSQVDVMIRIIVFVLSALPQAIKVFSFRGILYTQLAAAAFFAATVISWIRTLNLEDLDEELDDLIKELKEKKWQLKRYLGPIIWTTNLFLSCWVWSLINHHNSAIYFDDHPYIGIALIISCLHWPMIFTMMAIYRRHVGKTLLHSLGGQLMVVTFAVNGLITPGEKSIFWNYCVVVHMYTFFWYAMFELE